MQIFQTFVSLIKWRTKVKGHTSLARVQNLSAADHAVFHELLFLSNRKSRTDGYREQSERIRQRAQEKMLASV